MAFLFNRYKIIELGLLAILIFFMPGLKPDGLFSSYEISPPVKLEGPYAVNILLNEADHLYSGLFKGPENIVEIDGQFYTGVHGGHVIKLGIDNVQNIVKFGMKCEGFYQEAKCGRPFGLATDGSKDTLYVADAYYGIWKVNVKNGTSECMVFYNIPIKGRVPKIFNSLDVSSRGDIYFTDSSTDVGIEDGLYAMFMDGTGRLMKYSADKRRTDVLLGDLVFPTGVVISPTEEFVVVAEMVTSQLLKHYIAGPKIGKTETFLGELPGFPNKLTAYGDYILVPLVHARDLEEPVLFQNISTHPFLRRILVRMMALIEGLIRIIHAIIPKKCFEEVIHTIGHFESVSMFSPTRVSILVVDWEGNVVESWHNLDGSLSAIGSVHLSNGYAYFGSPYNTYIGRTKIPKTEFNLEKYTTKAEEE